MELYEKITLAIAIWGAVTGSIALFVRLRSFIRDRAKLKIKPFFEKSYSTNSLPPTIRLGVKIANEGRRPASLDRVVGKFGRNNHKVLQFNLSQEVKEGKATNIFIKKGRLPNDKNFHDLERVIVLDQTGKEWKSKKKFGQQKIKNLFNAEVIEKELIKNDDKRVDLKIYKVGKDYLLSTLVVFQPTNKWRRENFDNLKSAEDRFKRYSKIAHKFVNGEIDQFEFAT